MRLENMKGEPYEAPELWLGTFSQSGWWIKVGGDVASAIGKPVQSDGY